ncbi:dihydrolipoyl dehydrogenase [[Acholeplasma] multilocale]|uniref:dihydrolipoyl dehydrogenase n=1 Tax=[Acholeplasma] multilocale TaxID=264638 RepID=UPI0009FE56C1|nr:dihydrolipoyl dehydrogenase [[Acholeplasma] multilocale]
MKNKINIVEDENASVVGSTPISNDVIPSRIPNMVKPVKDLIKPHFDVIVVGAGIGGYIHAIKAAQLGLNVMVVEKGAYGGVCLNIGCIPTKALLKTVKVYDDVINKTKKFGIDIEAGASININWDTAQERKNNVVKKLTNGVKYLLDKNKVTRVAGVAKAISSTEIVVDDNKYYTCDNLVIATGSIPRKLNLPGFERAREKEFLIDSTGALGLQELPKKIVIIGGGVIGVEFACLFSNLGIETTILQGLPTILEVLDEDLSKEMTKELRNKYKIQIITGAKITEIKHDEIFFKLEGNVNSIRPDVILESIGRQTVIQGFENINLELSPQKFINVNEYCETNIKGVYAIGDVTSKAMLAHVASHQGIIAANHIAKLKGLESAHDLVLNIDRIPSCIYSHPEIATIGKTEQQLIEQNIEYKQFKFPFNAIGKALADDHTSGFVKLIIEPKYKTVIGAHIIGNRATEMISEITTLIECEGTISEVARAIHPHPTMSEAIGEAAEALDSGFTLNL